MGEGISLDVSVIKRDFHVVYFVSPVRVSI